MTTQTNQPPAQRPRTAILGAGTIGLSWALFLLTKGWEVSLYSRSEDAGARIDDAAALYGPALSLSTADWHLLRKHLHVTTDLAAAVASAAVVVENIIEDLSAKQELFRLVELAAPKDALLLSSTSTLLPQDIGARLSEPARLIVAHPFNPPHVIPLVEVVPGPDTPEHLVIETVEFFDGVDRTPVVLRRAIPGFIANRLQTALLRESIHLVQEGVGTVEEIDAAVTESIGLRWATTGPFLAAHLAGGPGGLRHWFGHIGSGLEQGWKALGNPGLGPKGIEELITQAEESFGTDRYKEHVGHRDARQLAVVSALKGSGIRA